MSLTFKLMDWVKQMPLFMWVGLIQVVEGLDSTKKWWPSHRKESIPLATRLELGHQPFPAFRLQRDTGSS
jgi:hypothetical protein